MALHRTLAALGTALCLLAPPQTARSQVPPDIAARLQAVGRVIDVPGTAALYGPLQQAEPYAAAQVSRDQRYGPHDAQRLDLFAPASTPAHSRAVLVFVHGGGFVRGDKHPPGSPFYDNVMLWAAAQGMIGVNLNFRMPPASPWPAATEDIGLALRWVRENIAAHGGDPQQVYLLGHSSGAALAASYLAHPRFRAVDGAGLAGAILLSANIIDPTTAPADPPLKAYFGDDPGLYAERSSLPGLLQTPLPLMVATTELDPPALEQQATQLRQALCQQGRCPTIARFEGHSHLSAVYSINTADDTVGRAVLAFIKGATARQQAQK